MAENQKISLIVGGHRCTFTVDRSEEVLFRKAEKEANEMISKIKAAFDISQQDVLAYATLLLALDKLELVTSRSVDDDMTELVALDRQLEAHLKGLK